MMTDNFTSNYFFLVFDSIGMDKLRAKGLQLSGFMIELLEDKFHDQVKILTPKDEKSRGCQGMLSTNLT